ncbi:hypothetical protein CAPTEDRAFT_221089 [Capitella teleta]|uniref:Regulation of nuclear pre-mRNA domain-containing protein 2 n=1 Tax=Capitella teleta TaxID=283909 RepID=R7TUJ5_CAPTE|nr:hypothetical protein CAPTEDRAFT_221089 [Capitella teleta]|eukprot:ELT97252.1 hypothetical protein CAPTEDRAFT_221089 [Capitella teleta]
MDEESVAKKLRGVNATQDNIQSLAIWVLHHKAHHEKIVDIWFKVLKKSKMPHRLTLFYLCNDIVQNSKRKHAMCYKDQFKEVLKDATLLVRDISIRSKVERLYNIWSERNVYDQGYTEELKSILNDTKVRAAMSSKLLAEFQPKALTNMIMKVKRCEEEIEMKRRQVANLKMDSSDLEAIKKLKDKGQGQQFLRQFELSCLKLEDFVKVVEEEIKDRAALVELLEESELFYDAQHGEAKIVANAYKNFGVRVNNQRRRLTEHCSNLPAASSPPISPSAAFDAPSPGDTPPQAMGNDDISTVDMEMSDEEQDPHRGGGHRGQNTGVTPSYSQPIASVTQIQMKKTKALPLADRCDRLLEARGALGGAAPSSPDMPQGSPMGPNESPASDDRKVDSFVPGYSDPAKSAAKFLSNLISQIDGDNSSGSKEGAWAASSRGRDSKAPLSETGKDDGSATPVMDEIAEAAAAPPVAVAEKPVVKTNAIDFLTQLINQTKNADKKVEEEEEEVTKEEQEAEEQEEWPQWKQNSGPPPPLMGLSPEATRPPPPLMSQPLLRTPPPNGQGPFGQQRQFNLPPPPRPPNLSPPRPPPSHHLRTPPDLPPWGQRSPFRPPGMDQAPPFHPGAPPPRPTFPPTLSAPPRPPFVTEPYPRAPHVTQPGVNPPPPANQSPASVAPPPPKEKDPLAEVQEEFIEKLKRRSSVSESDPPKRSKSEDDEKKEEPADDDLRDPRRRLSAEKYDSHRSSSRGPPPAPFGRAPPPPDAYMSERDRWAYEMARQQFFKDMYAGRSPHGRRPVSSHDGRHYPRH